MSTLFRFRNFAIAVGLVSAVGCKAETERKSDRAAEKVLDKRDDVHDELSKDENLAKRSLELGTANAEFAQRKQDRLATLNAVYTIYAQQPNMISQFAAAEPLTDQGRMNVTDKVRVFQMRLDEAKNMISGMQALDATAWKDRDDAVTDQMKSVNDARSDAWDALRDAERITPPSS
jgi:hypothetical protein